MTKFNVELIVNKVSLHITNINKCLKNIKSDIITDFICITNDNVIITMNKLTITSNLMIIEKYIKSIDNIKSDFIKSLYLLKSSLSHI